MLSRRMLLAGVAFSGFGQTPSRPTANYPGRDWAIHDRQGWSVPLLTAARQNAATKKTLAVMVVQSGQVVDSRGPVEQKIQVRSIRKSFLSALYGIYVAEGRIDLGKTLADLNIDDDPPGTAERVNKG